MDEIVVKQIALVHKLYELTVQKKIPWEFDGYYGSVEAVFSGLEVSLSNVEHEGTPFETIKISRNGNQIDYFTDSGLEGNPRLPEFDSYWKFMVALRELAARQAAKIEETLDKLLETLEEVDNPKSLPKPNPFDDDLDDVPF
jgi:hypothetical protein